MGFQVKAALDNHDVVISVIDLQVSENFPFLCQLSLQRMSNRMICPQGNTLLHIAASQGHRSVVKDLLRRGAGSSKRAIWHLMICCVFLNISTDPLAKNFEGRAPHELARALNYWEVMSQIEDTWILPFRAPVVPQLFK